MQLQLIRTGKSRDENQQYFTKKYHKFPPISIVAVTRMYQSPAKHDRGVLLPFLFSCTTQRQKYNQWDNKNMKQDQRN